MYSKLDAQAKDVIICQTKAVLAGEIEGKRNATRRIYVNETEEITRWPLGDQPDNYQVGLMGDYAQKMIRWANDQNEQICRAFERNIRNNLAGGVPVIAGTAEHRKIKDQDLAGFNAEARTGEFCGIIKGARSIESVMSNEVVEIGPKQQKKEQEQEKAVEEDREILPSLVSGQLNKVATGLLEAISNATDDGNGITREEAYEIYEAERQIYYTLTRGLGIKANEYEKNRRKPAEKRYNETKKGRFGMALRQAAEMLKVE